MKKVYLDHGAATPTDPRVLRKALPYFSKKFANPSSIHSFGKKAKLAIENARVEVANFLNCEPNEVIFTSGGTEAENLAVKGIAFSAKASGKHIIISAVEHAAVVASAEYLEKFGFVVKKVSVDARGNVNLGELENLLDTETTFVAIMLANNEIGTLEPIRKVANIIESHNRERSKSGMVPVRLHTDAEAGAFYTDCDVKKLGVDSLCLNGSKLYAMKGVGALYVKSGIKLATQVSGGGQEHYLRGGTENVPA